MIFIDILLILTPIQEELRSGPKASSTLLAVENPRKSENA